MTDFSKLLGKRVFDLLRGYGEVESITHSLSCPIEVLFPDGTRLMYKSNGLHQAQDKIIRLKLNRPNWLPGEDNNDPN